MILQNASETGNSARFVMKNTEHAALAADIVWNMGNGDFDLPEPEEEIRYLITHHDHGWYELDNDPPINEQDGLPYNLVHTPMDYILQTSSASPDFNEKYSAFCGLLSSMHTYGLYNGRYGLSDAINMDWIPEDKRPAVDAMLSREMKRQQMLKEKLKGTELEDESVIFRTYKILQFADACALYFNMNPAGQRGQASFRNVPSTADRDEEIEVAETDEGTYMFKPYPFRSDEFTLSFAGRYLEENPGSVSNKSFKSAQIEHQTVKIRRN